MTPSEDKQFRIPQKIIITLNQILKVAIPFLIDTAFANFAFVFLIAKFLPKLRQFYDCYNLITDLHVLHFFIF